jgi:hypothetical protein
MPSSTENWSRPSSAAADAFLAESYRRVIAHCERLLAAHDLAAEERARLARLLNQAEGELRRLTWADAA